MQASKRPRSRLAHQRRTLTRSLSVPALLAGLMLASGAGIGAAFGEVSLDHLKAVLPGSGCDIKGNVSNSNGERIYHVPGQKYYAETRIFLFSGERWFCSEDEATQAGWRRSKV